MMTVIYEVTAVVRAELLADYEKYMCDRHIPELIATGYFRGARFARSTENPYRIIYEAHNRDALDCYLRNDAERLRADFLSHFPAGIELSRENWRVLAQWDSKRKI